LEQNFDEIIGQGDFDPATYRRIETGMSAIAAIKGHTTNHNELAKVVATAQTKNRAGAPPTASNNNILTAPASAMRVTYKPAATIRSDQPWSVQIGAFTSRAATDEAIQKTLRTLPAPYSGAQAIIAPLKTAEGWLFRGRLTGFTKTEALAACNYIPDCLPVAPAN
jgi:cell division septation protein DedD